MAVVSRKLAAVLFLGATLPALAGMRIGERLQPVLPAAPDYQAPDLPRQRVDAGSAYARLRQALRLFAHGRFVQTRRLLQRLAREGDVSAWYYLGILHDKGAGVPRNPALALQWYLRAARAGHVDAQYNAGVAYANGDGVQADMRQAIHWWVRAARQGNLDASYNLGMIYMTGRGVPRNIPEAVRWWRRAARHGDVVAQYNLGVIFANGDGVRRDVCRASRYWRRSASQGFARARQALRLLAGGQPSCIAVSAAR